MSTLQTTLDEKPAKFKTTLYLTETNKRRLEQLTKGSRTKLINQAIAEKLEEIEQGKLQKKLLHSLDTLATVPSHGVSTQEALHEIRTRELQNLVPNR